MSKVKYLIIWGVVNSLFLVLFSNILDIETWKVCLIFFVSNMTGMLCEYIGNDLEILNQEKR